MNSKQNIVKLLNVLKDTYPKSRAFQAHDAVDRAIRIVNAVTSLTPAIEWKPFNKDEMEVGKWYLICGIKWDYPDIGKLLDSGLIESGNAEDEWGGAPYLYGVEDVTHYAEFNKPEGVE